uniref:tetratricopeptide repeat protein n=1 Tax=Alistipes megaguti TaxID=2364787 RepID=UPI000EFD1CD4|nr:tetratricopeptide repeat protein [Alistipes megaguti]
MKHLVILGLSCLFFTGTIRAQVAQKGNVRIYNSHKTPLAGVQLLAAGAPATDSDGEGHFCLDFIHAQPGTAISSPFVYKKGYELVNEELLNGWILTEKRPMEIVMAPEGTIEEQKNRYYAIAVEHFTRLRNQTIDSINRLYTRREMSQEERAQRLRKLAEENRAYLKTLDEYAEKFARINPDDIDEMERQVLELVDSGRLEEAIELYRNSGLIEQAGQKLQQRTEADEDITALVERMYRYADLCTLAGGAENERKSYDVYQWIARILPDRFPYVLNYTLRKINRFEEDLDEWIDRCQQLAYDEKSLLLVLTLRTTVARNLRHDYTQALEYGIQALQILQQAHRAMPSGDYLAIYHQTSFNLAQTYEAMHQWDEAEEIYLDEIRELQDEIAQSDNPAFVRIQKGTLVNTYTALMDLYADREETQKAEQVFAQVRDFIAQHMPDDEQTALALNQEHLDMMLQLAMKAGDQKKAYAAARQAWMNAEERFRKNPHSTAAEYLGRYKVYLTLCITADNDAFLEEAARFRDRIGQEFAGVSDEQRIQALVGLEIAYATFYAQKGNLAEARPHIRKANDYAEELSRINPSGNAETILLVRAKYIDDLLTASKTQEAALAALDLETLYAMQALWGYESLVVENSIGTALVTGGLYDLGLKYLEHVKEAREAELKRHPDNTELKFSLCTTYNNLALGYGKLKKYPQALREQKKAYELMKALYPLNKVSMGTNYMLMTLNTSICYYRTGDNEQALGYAEEALAIAEEMKRLNPLFDTYPILIKLAKGDLLNQLSLPGGRELQAEGLNYRPGSLPNDTLLRFGIEEYRRNGYYNR